MPGNTKRSPATVIVIGPAPAEFGGMASVVQQMLELDFGDAYRLEAFPVTLAPDEPESTFGRTRRHARHMSHLRKVIRRTAAPIVHIHTCSGFSFFRSVADMTVARGLGCRVVLHIHGAAFDEFHANAGRLRQRLIASSLSRADRVIGLSQSWCDKLRDMAPNARLTIIENAVATPPEPLARQASGPCRFLLLARMDEWKGIDNLLAACAELHADGVAAELTLAGPPGTAGDEAILAHKIGDKGLQDTVRYVGPVQGDDKTSLLQWADAYVQPSHHEGMPIALLEALSYGLPVVATRVGAVPEVITDEAEGILVLSHRPDLLALAMRHLAENDDLRRTMTRAARQLATTRFSLNRFRDDLMALYNDLSGVRREPAPQSDALPVNAEARELTPL
jgi:glycosyltransferase involved in cell wall biosynthesis